MNEDNKLFAIVEIYGKQCYAGQVSEQKIGENSFVRIDVPGIENKKPFTKLFNGKAIFSMTPVDEETVFAWLKQYHTQPPVTIYKALLDADDTREPF
jgi:hypothetical protein